MRCCCFFLVALSVCANGFAEETDAKFVEIFLQTHCVRCHNADKNKGELNLDDLGTNLAAGRASFAAALERLKAGDMPPKDEPQPDPAAVDRVTKWLQQGLAALPAAPVESAARPSEGNHLPHALLFGGKPGPSVPPPPRLWRLSPEGYSVGFLQSLRVDSHRIPQPFALRSDPGIKDYSALYWIDDGSTNVLIRNAEKIVDAITSHKLFKNGSSIRVSMASSGDEPIAFEEFAPLLHPTVAPKREQLETAIRVLYQNALVREPSAEEIESLIQLYHEASKPPGDLVSASKTMLMAPLLSPEVLHRFEIGRGAEVRPGVRMLSPGELAFALSLAFSGERESGLFNAATSGGLKTREDVEKHVRRILEDPDIYKPRILGFFHEYFGYDRAPEVCKDAQPDYFHHADQLVVDTDLLVLSILEKDQDVLKELLTTPKSFVNGAAIKFDGAPVRNPSKLKLGALMGQQLGARVSYYATDEPASGGLWGRDVRKKFRNLAQTETAYGFKEWPAKQPVDLPGDRIGILMQPSWLVAWSSNFFNDPVRRGLWIREHLLGHAVPQVPVGVVIVLPDDPSQTLRQRMQITKDQACWKCHVKIDDLGFPFEAFDHFGRPRDSEFLTEKLRDASEPYAKDEKTPAQRIEAPIDSTGNIYASGDPQLDGPVEDAAEMIRRLAESERVRQVFIRYVFRYFMGRNETAGDAATLQEADRVYVESGGSFKELVVSLLTSEAFLYRTMPADSERYGVHKGNQK
ncbi:DUF1588 domain-containing protein [Lignipirellula cremea]|uniref:Planctomycete cytochrome C n=1 Tax=Lignipirellula cremea TaxID=2528010 RepID=A0A518DKD1_9BACT|nr:DUF1588 domain-containing protein [Lignipirellula cremea]QDU92288.1 hypothetical protein Pla8534_00330 [Lignipirellula cremea]